MSVVIDDVGNWFEVYVLDDEGNFLVEADDIYYDLDSAFAAVKKLTKEYLL